MKSINLQNKMVTRTGPTNQGLKNLLIELRKQSNKEKVMIWKKVAEYLIKSTRQRKEVNIFKIEKYAKSGETLLVPGKVLAKGDLTKKLTVSAFRFSEGAKEKINKTGKAITIKELMKTNPKGSKVRIFG